MTHPDFVAAIGGVARDMLRELEQADAHSSALTGLTLEKVFSDASFMDVPASPLQLAITRIAQQRPLECVIDEQMCQAHFGCVDPWRGDEELARAVFRVVLICGVRGGKSFLSIGHALTSCLTVNLSHLPVHEVTRYAIVGPDIGRAEDTYRKLLGFLATSPGLAPYVYGEPTKDTATLRRPDGRVVEISVVAASMGGRTVRGIWLLGLTVEEAALFGSASTGAVVNVEEIIRAAEPRILPGGQIWIISSPYGPVGLLYDLYKRHFGKHGKTLVVHAPTRALNPTFPQKTIDEMIREDPDNAAREFGAEWVDSEMAFLESGLVDDAIRNAPVVRPGRAKFAAIDPATRGNAWTLAVSDYELVEQGNDPETPKAKRVIINGVWQWIGSKKEPLSPRRVFSEIAQILHGFGIKRVHSDGWSLDALADHARTHGLTLERFGEGTTKDDDGDPYASLKTLATARLLELPPDPTMRQDLLSIRRKVTANAIKIELPKTQDGRHCDFAPSVALAAHLAAAGKIVTFGYDAAPSANAAASSRRNDYDDDDDDDDSGSSRGRGGFG